jgi:hypothetical protein
MKLMKYKEEMISISVETIVILPADHSGRAVLGMNRLRPLEHWDRWFEYHSRHGCLCAFILFVLSCV